MRFIAIAFALLAMSSPVYAACYCTCVNGYVQALCENDWDVPPVCAPQVCAPTFTPTPRPVDPPVVPRPGQGTDCKYEQVYSYETSQYEWRLVCR